MSAVHLLLGLVVAQRIAELAISRANAKRLLARGAVEAGAGHYLLFPLLHASWIMAMALTIPAEAAIGTVPLALFGLLQLGRLWVISSLGDYWTTRVFTVPGAPLVRAGPYRFLRHPNYLLVAGEFAVVPLIFDAWVVAVAFSALNGALLAHRIGVENQALAERRVALN